MITLKEYIEAIEYRISEGSEYQWRCFGDYARYLECHGPVLNQDYSISAIFDSQDQTVYAVEAWDYRNNRTYRWTNPEYVSVFREECVKHNVDPNETFDGEKYIDLDVEEDILEKINAMVNQREYDDRVKVPINFTDDELLTYMKMAHERDITFNQLVEEALREAIEEHKRNPEAFKQRVDNFIKEQE